MLFIFGISRIFGHIFKKDGIQVEEGKINAVKAWAPLETVN